MSTYCRITGNSRGLPKPHYFPLLPPISPADAKRLCRITGKSYGLPTHHYIPVLTGFMKKQSRVPCHITTKAECQEVHHYLPVGVQHTVLKDYRYVFPVLETNADLLKMLDTKSIDENNENYVYTVKERNCSLVFPCKLEAAVRDGDVRDIMLAKESDTLLLKLRKGGSVEVDVKDICVDGMQLYDGEGPNEDPAAATTVVKKKKRKNRENNEWRRKIFENKEKKDDDEEERISEMKAKKIKVKLADVVKEPPPPPPATPQCTWKNVQTGALYVDPDFDRIIVNTAVKSFNEQGINDFVNVPGAPIINSLPQPIVITPENIDLSISIPGIIQQILITGENVVSLPLASAIVPFRPFVPKVTLFADNALAELNANKTQLANILEKQNHLQKRNIDVLPSIEDIPLIVDTIEAFAKASDTFSKRNKVEQGLLVKVAEDTHKYVPGQFLRTSEGEIFVPGNVIETPAGPAFVPGIAINTPNAIKLLPGRVLEDRHSNTSAFVAGQIALTRDGEKFVQGQMISVDGGETRAFVPGQTVFTDDGTMKFVAGQIVENADSDENGGYKFAPGQIVMTTVGPQFVPGQFTAVDSSNGEKISFIAGQSAINENCNWEFVPGQGIKTDDGNCVFVPGKNVTDDSGRRAFIPGRMAIESNGKDRFVPGLTINEKTGNAYFVPGMQLNTPDGSKFVEGIITEKDNAFTFSAGQVVKDEKDNVEFYRAKTNDDIVLHDIRSNFGVCLNSVTVPKCESDEIFGHLVQSTQGVEFFPGEEAVGLPAGKVIPGRLVKGDEIRFIPGTMMNREFVPGQFVTTSDDNEKFVPGQVIETNDGPKFVPGQILQTKSGPKFVPGQTMETEDGPKFVPGQIIDTKSGPTFIPGQVIFTEEEGSRFVPGRLVETVEGPRFVPGKVVETDDRVTFIPGQIVETEDGLKFIAPDLEDDPEGGYQFTVQGFEISEEELKVIQRNSVPYTCFTGEMAIDSRILRQLADAGMVVGRQFSVEVPVVNIKSLPVMETAFKVANRLGIDTSYSIKMSHILSSLQQIKQSNVLVAVEQIENENLKTLVSCALKCENGVEDAEFLRILSDALENTLADVGSIGDKLRTVDTLHALTTSLASQVREEKPNKVLLLKNILKNNFETRSDIVEKLSSILNEQEMAICVAFQHMSEENPQFVERVLENAAAMLKNNSNDEKEAIRTLHRAIIKTVTETSESKVRQALDNVESDDFRSLAIDAIGLAKALGLGEVVTTLSDILKDSKSIPILAKDAIVMEVLKRLTIMRQLAGKRPHLGGALYELQSDPYAARNNPKLRELVRESAVLMVIPEESTLRSSEDIPASLLFSDNSLVMEDFMARNRQCGSTFLILKKGLQAVVPREAAKDVLMGKVPYTVLDENGIHYFKPLHVFNALKLPRFATDRFSSFDDSAPSPTAAKYNRNNSINMEDLRRNLYKCCASQEEMEEEFVLVKDFTISDDDYLYADIGEKVKISKTDDEDPTLRRKPPRYYYNNRSSSSMSNLAERRI